MNPEKKKKEKGAGKISRKYGGKKRKKKIQKGKTKKKRVRARDSKPRICERQKTQGTNGRAPVQKGWADGMKGTITAIPKKQREKKETRGGKKNRTPIRMKRSVKPRGCSQKRERKVGG